MQLWHSDEEKRVYTENGVIYTMLNLGRYVGCNGRSKDTKIPEYWKLIFMEKEMFDVNDIRIDALIDETGTYVRFVMKCGWLQRTILFDKDNVVYDSVENTLGIANKNILGSVYKSTNNDFNKKKVSISEYLSQEATFVSLEGNHLENNPLTNEEIRMFFVKSEELSNDNVDTKKRIKKK